MLALCIKYMYITVYVSSKVSIFGHYQCSDTFSWRRRDVLATIYDDKIVRDVYFLETYCRNSSHFSSSSSTLTFPGATRGMNSRAAALLV